MKILIHTPVSNRAWILPEWWRGVCSQTYPHEDIQVLFDLNDSQDGTGELLRVYLKGSDLFDRVTIIERYWPPLGMPDHVWNEERYRRMRMMRNDALARAEEGDFEYVFSLDSDVILHDPDTLTHFVQARVPIIAGVFTAKWGNDAAVALPNIWERGQNEMSPEFLESAHKVQPHYRVGGLGACVLIAEEVWKQGVHYAKLYNLPSGYRGEDRDFCVRAAAAGFDLMACTHKRIEHRDKPKILCETA